MALEHPGYGPRDCEGGVEEPLFNKFGIPVILQPSSITYEGDAVSDPPVHVECCGDCAAWTQCLWRVPIMLTLNGFNVTDWLKSSNFSAHGTTVEEHDGAELSGDTGDPIFVGEYLTIPWHRISPPLSRARGAFNDPTVPCVDYESLSPPDDVGPPYVTGVCGSHVGLAFRRVNTPFGWASPTTEIWFDAFADCHLNDNDDPVIQIKVYMFCVVEAESVHPPLACSHRGQICCEILRSDEIPVTDELSLTDLVDIPLYPRNYDDWKTQRDDWDDCVAASTNNGPDPCRVLQDGACWTGTSESDPEGEYIEQPTYCNPPGYNCDATLTEDPPCAETGIPELVLDDPTCFREVEAVEPVDTEPTSENRGNFASVIIFECKLPVDCTVCPDTGDKLKQKVTIDFTYTGGCTKTFTAVSEPDDCLDIILDWWSFGKTGNPVTYTLANGPVDGGSGFAEEITLVRIDSRGCYYIITKEVTCDCPCEGVSGGAGFAVEPTEDPCTYDIVISCAIFGPEECKDGAFIEICITDGTQEYDCPECSEPCPGCLALGDGDETTIRHDFVADGPICFAWRLWDGICGCPSEWFYVPYYASGAPCYIQPGDCP